MAERPLDYNRSMRRAAGLGLLPLYREMAKSYIFLISYKDQIRGRKIRRLFNVVELYNAEQRSKMGAPSSLGDTPAVDRAVDIVDELLSAKHSSNCIIPARG
jgi:hypothetical protein